MLTTTLNITQDHSFTQPFECSEPVENPGDYFILRMVPSSIMLGFLLVTICSIFLIILGSTLCLMLSNRGTSTTDLLALVLRLLHCLAAPFLLLSQSKSDKTVLGFELHQGILVVVNDAKASRLSTSELGTEAEEDDERGGGLVHASDDFLKFRLGDIGAARVDDVNNHLQGVQKDGDGDAKVRRSIKIINMDPYEDEGGTGRRHAITASTEDTDNLQDETDDAKASTHINVPVSWKGEDCA